jgi:hypothetical protein
MRKYSNGRNLRLALKRRQQKQSPDYGEKSSQECCNDSLSPLPTVKAIAGEASVSNPQNDQDKGKDSPSDRSIAKSTGVIAVLTGVLAIMALISAIITGFQWYELHSGSVDTHALAIAAESQAKAVADQARLTQQQLRAWAFVSDLRIFDSIRYEKTGYAHATVEIEVKNTGHLPAFNAFTRAALIDATITDDTPEHQAELLCYDEPGAPIFKSGEMTVFPGEKQFFLIGADLTKAESALLKQNPIEIWPVIVGCVKYSIVPGGDIHRSGFAYNIFIKNGDTRDIMLHTSDAPIPKEQISLRRSPQAAFAD